jgi:hypothetical protein
MQLSERQIGQIVPAVLNNKNGKSPWVIEAMGKMGTRQQVYTQ